MIGKMLKDVGMVVYESTVLLLPSLVGIRSIPTSFFMECGFLMLIRLVVDYLSRDCSIQKLIMLPALECSFQKLIGLTVDYLPLECSFQMLIRLTIHYLM